VGSRDHAITCALCDYDRGGLNDSKCKCDDLVDSGSVSLEFANKARAIAAARDEACDLIEEHHEHEPRRPIMLRVPGLRAVGKDPT